MITTAVIKSVPYIENNACLCKILVPLFGTNGSKNRELTAHVAITPGMFQPYTIDDLVWVDFKENIVNEPVIIGLIYSAERHNRNLESDFKSSIGLTAGTVQTNNIQLEDIAEITFKENTIIDIVDDDNNVIKTLTASTIQAATSEIADQASTASSNYVSSTLNKVCEDLINRISGLTTISGKTTKEAIWDLYYLKSDSLVNDGTDEIIDYPSYCSMAFICLILYTIIIKDTSFRTGCFYNKQCTDTYPFLQVKNVTISSFCKEIENTENKQNCIITNPDFTETISEGDILIINDGNDRNPLNQAGIVLKTDTASKTYTVLTVEKTTDPLQEYKINKTKKISKNKITTLIKTTELLGLDIDNIIDTSAIPTDSAYHVGFGQPKSYMAYTALGTKTTEYSICGANSHAKTDSESGIRYINPGNYPSLTFYCAAIGTGWGGGVGDVYYVALTRGSGTGFLIIQGDTKANIHTDAQNKYHLVDKSVVEFITDDDGKYHSALKGRGTNKLANCSWYGKGNLNSLTQFNGDVKNIIKLGMYDPETNKVNLTN